MIKLRRFALNLLKTILLPVVVIALFAAITGGKSFSLPILMLTLQQSVLPTIISMALIGNMTLGMWDFSAGGVILATAIIGGNLMNLTGTGIFGLVIFSIAISVVLTTFTGFLNNVMKVPTLVVTIGLVLIYETMPRLIFPNGVTIKAKYAVLALPPYCFIILAAAFALFYYIYIKSVYGHNVLALGGSESIARSAGLNAPRIKQIGFLISGVFLGVASVLYMSQNGQLFNVSALGSIGTIFSAMMGVFLAFFLASYCNTAIALVIGTFTMTVLTNGFIALRISATARDVVTGFFLLILLIISANQGRYVKWRADRERARKANALINVKAE